MVTVNVYELFNMASQLVKNNVTTVEIMDCDTFLSFDAIDPVDEDNTIGYGEIFDINSPEASPSFTINAETIAPFVSTFGELGLTHAAYKNAIQNCLNELNSTSISAEERHILRDLLSQFETYVNSLEAFLSKFQG